MLTFASLYPKIDLNNTFYEDMYFKIGVNVDKYYLISKFDKTVILFEKKHPQKIMTFIDLILVDKLRYNSTKQLFQELGETTGSGRSTLKSSYIRLLLEGDVVEPEYIPTLEDIHSREIELLKEAYKNDCSTHLNINISRQIKEFMQYLNHYEIRIKDFKGFKNYKKIIAIIDEINDKIYKSIIHEEIVYFSNPLQEKPEKEQISKHKFTLNDYTHYESFAGCTVDLFSLSNVSIESHYDIDAKQYKIFCNRTLTVDDYVTIETYEKTVEQEHYDINFIFNFVFETEIIHHPSPNFIKELRELDILIENERMDIEHLRLYEMTII